MPKIFSHRFIIPTDANDENGHVNNVAYVQWMQNVATMHSDEQGCTRELYHSINSSWIVRSHQIEYLKPAFAGDEIEIQTWICNLKTASSLRRYRFLDANKNTVLAKAETNWVYVNAMTGRPKRIDSQVSELFILVSPEEEP